MAATGTNPEQLFAAGYSACFLGAMKFVAQRDSLPISPDVTVTATVGASARSRPVSVSRLTLRSIFPVWIVNRPRNW